MWNKLLIKFFICIICCCNRYLCNVDSTANQWKTKEMTVLDEILRQDRYDPRAPPAAANKTVGPTSVEFDVLLQRISHVSDVNMEIDTSLTLRQKWLDARLKFDDFDGEIKYLTLTDVKRIWLPDAFFSNQNDGQLTNSVGPNSNIRIFANGSVVYSIRVSLTLSCPMNFKRFPMDIQSCPLTISSFGYSKDELAFQWRSENPVEVSNDMQVPRFRLVKFQPVSCTEERSCIRIDLHIGREFNHYFITLYIPCCMLIMVSWLCFWLDQTAVTTRVFLSSAVLLSMTFMVANFNTSIPQTNYTKAIDMWTGICLTFAFNTLVEVVLVNYVSRRCKHRSAVKKSCHGYAMEMENTADVALVPDNPPVDDEDKIEISSVGGEKRTDNACDLFKFITGMCGLSWLARRYPSTPERIDAVARFLFPLMFFLFVVAYFTAVLLTKGSDDN